MTKISFLNDYSTGAHPNILKALSETNDIVQTGYGEDLYCQEASNLIKQKLENQDVDIHFIASGTLTNLVAISAVLKSYESVISASSGHINVHEAGAIEATGHKINCVEKSDGKLEVCDIQKVLDFHHDEHLVKPKLVYISQSTELGTIYKKQELQEISTFCKKNNLILFLDGARLGTALTSSCSDLSFKEIADLVDMFYIGGTKNGALLGEALVICNDTLKENFKYFLKQRGALLAKGRVLGLQFRELFKDDLFLKIAINSNLMAETLKQGIVAKGYKFWVKPETNQIFPILENKLIEKLQNKYEFYIWTKIDQSKSAIRLVTSWDTDIEAVNYFIADL